MAWKKKTVGNFGDQVAVESGIAAPGEPDIKFTSEIDFLPLSRQPNRYISILAEASGTVNSTHIEVALYGAYTPGGTKFLLVDNIVTALTNAAKTAGARLDLNAYPAPYYYVSFTSDIDDTGVSFKLSIYIPQLGG